MEGQINSIRVAAESLAKIHILCLFVVQILFHCQLVIFS
ncbi:Uncharacterised protein [Legionella pneumophila]|nr:Uncharacterised protein [Legionella pneumophila]